MELRSQLFWTVILMQVLEYHCVIVCFLSQQPIHVLIGQDLILRAQLDLPAGDHITKVTWEHEAGKRASRRMKVGEYPSQGSGGRVGVNHNGALILQKFQMEDSEAGRHVSVMVNVSHSSQEAWGTDPTFTWLHEKVSVTEALGHMSPDGSSLYLAGPLCGHFTCVVSNKLGHSSATYTAEPCERESGGTTVAVPHAPAICGWRYGLPALEETRAVQQQKGEASGMKLRRPSAYGCDPHNQTRSSALSPDDM